MQTAAPAKQTTIAQHREHIRSVQGHIQPLLGFTEQSYCNLIFHNGLKYLEEIMPFDPQAIRDISYSRVYWNWWKNHWAIRDEDFLKDMAETRSVTRLRCVYSALHDPKALADEVTYHGKHLASSYTTLFQAICRDVTGE